jgi:hypothetical protein
MVEHDRDLLMTGIADKNPLLKMARNRGYTPFSDPKGVTQQTF